MVTKRENAIIREVVYKRRPNFAKNMQTELTRILDKKCPKCEGKIACLFAIDATPSDYYFESLHICLNPNCDYCEYEWEKEGNLGGGPNVNHISCLICNRRLYEHETETSKSLSKVCVRVDCNCPFNPEWVYYPKDIIGLHQIDKDDPRAKINSKWDEKGGYRGYHYSQSCEEEICNPCGEVVEIYGPQDCQICPHKSNCPFE